MNADEMTSAVARLRPLITPPTVKHTASLIFLHGSGDTGEGVKSWLRLVHKYRDLSFPHIRLIYPTAPLRPYTPNGGMPSTVWFDRSQISPSCDENIDSIDISCHAIDSLVECEVKNGVPRNRIIVGGFSMGGALAMYYGFRQGLDLAGIFALSSFINDNSVVYEHLKTSGAPIPSFFQCHGELDPLVLPAWGKRTHEELLSRGVVGEYHTYPDMFHEMRAAEINQLKKWVTSVLPDAT